MPEVTGIAGCNRERIAARKMICRGRRVNMNQLSTVSFAVDNSKLQNQRWRMLRVAEYGRRRTTEGGSAGRQ